MSPWGRDDLMAMAAVRYCLGRMTYIVSDCADWLIDQWENFSPSVRAVIKRDIEEAFEREQQEHDRGHFSLSLGAEIDRMQWERVRRLWAST